MIEALKSARFWSRYGSGFMCRNLMSNKMIIASPWYDSKGPQTTNRALVDRSSGRNIRKGADEKALYQESGGTACQGTRSGGQGTAQRTSRSTGVTTPCSLPPSQTRGFNDFQNPADLRRFLAEELHLKTSSIDDAYPGMLTSREVRRLGLI